MTTPLGAPAPSQTAPSQAARWLDACRPKTLTAAAAPVLVGTALAGHQGEVLWGPALATLVGALLLQIGSNFANDVFDFEKGADTGERLGPTRAVQAGFITPREMKAAMVFVFGLALAIGAYLTAVSGPTIVVIGVASILAAIAYTGGPYPLGYHGLGDVFVFLFFGLVAVNGTVFVHLGRVTALSFFCSLPLGALAANILAVNNLRDRYTDVIANKRTLAVRLGRTGIEVQYAALGILSYLTPLILVGLGALPASALLPLATLPLFWKNFSDVRQLDGRELNQTLGKTARLVFLFGASFALGISLNWGGP